jgi:hypothetical protein
MSRLPIAVCLAVLLLAAGCMTFRAGRAFPSPDPGLIVIGTTDKQVLEHIFGEPYQVGLDSGDRTWRWFYGQSGTGREQSKDLTVRFNPDGTVKSYSFTSNFPEDMHRLK